MNPEHKRLVHPDAVVQILPDHDETFGGHFMVVTEVKRWGVKGYVKPLAREGLAYYRAPWEAIEYVGPASWVYTRKEEEEDEGQ